jgi:Protein of unknown function (DUF2911)
MKTTLKFKAALLLIMAFVFTTAAHAQDDKKPLASPRDSVSGTINGAAITINYGSPSVKGRKIWGGLVPYDTVWRTGANEATRFTTSKDIWVEGKKLPAGTYGFFAIPTENTWTLIFNSIPNQWGAFKYDATKDVLRVKVKVKPNTMHERLLYSIDSNSFSLAWEDLKVTAKVK